MTDDRTIERRRLIAALLGPGAPELTCEECFEQIARYVRHAGGGTRRPDPTVLSPRR